MSRRPLMMIGAVLCGWMLAVGIDAGALERLMPTSGARQAHGPAAHATGSVLTPARHLDLEVAQPEEAAATEPGGHQVKTADTPIFVAQKYTDGQAPASATVVKDESTQAVAIPPAGPDPVVATAEAAGEPAPSTLNPTAAAPHEPVAQTVHTDYKEAVTEAAEDRKLLFVYFHESRPNAAQRAFETNTLADVVIKEQLKRYVLLRLPRDASIVENGQRVTLLEHPAFAEMLGRQGVAILDFAHARSNYYGHVVSTFPFTPGKYYTKEALSIILDLPPGTLTQRTMIYAVRIHPESPASTQGIFHNALADEAKDHADHQASILVQGHHGWDSRFHRINSKLPSGVVAQEVVAESWPNEGLVEACVDCVHSWRQSPGHWSAVRGRHPLFGYDIKRGRNGVWYATGIFGLGIFGRNK
ncbi:MAG: hypothetical protein WD845_01755 [Pirellulales bacterium]